MILWKLLLAIISNCVSEDSEKMEQKLLKKNSSDSGAKKIGEKKVPKISCETGYRVTLVSVPESGLQKSVRIF